MHKKRRNRDGVARHVEGRRHGVEEQLEHVDDQQRRQHRERQQPPVVRQLRGYPPCDDEGADHAASSVPVAVISPKMIISSVSASIRTAVTSLARPYWWRVAATSSGRLPTTCSSVTAAAAHRDACSAALQQRFAARGSLIETALPRWLRRRVGTLAPPF